MSIVDLGQVFVQRAKKLWVDATMLVKVEDEAVKVHHELRFCHIFVQKN